MIDVGVQLGDRRETPVSKYSFKAERNSNGDRPYMKRGSAKYLKGGMAPRFLRWVRRDAVEHGHLQHVEWLRM